MKFLDVFSLRSTNPQYTAFMDYQVKKAGTPIELTMWTPLNRISGFLVGAAIKGEDSNFFVHLGIDISSTINKTYYALRHKQPIRGISSITQQTARNLFLTPRRTFGRKFREALYAVLMERILSKYRILEIYLNTIEFGKGVWGCTAASSYYFNKYPDTLDLFEAIFLVSVLPAPRAELNGKNLQRLWKSQMQILHMMYLSELVTLQQFAHALCRAKGAYQLLADGVEFQRALAYLPAEVVPPPLPIKNQDEQCSCTLQAIFKTKCGLDKELERRRILLKLFQPAVLSQAMITNDYSLLSNSGSR